MLLSIVIEMPIGDSDAQQHGEGRTITVLDDMLTRTAGRLSMNAALLLGGAIYVAIGLAFPLIIDAPVFLLVSLNVLGVVLG